jgi:hypothetical protein
MKWLDRKIERHLSVMREQLREQLGISVLSEIDQKLQRFEATFSYMRALLPKGPVEFKNYPVWLEHPTAALPPVMVYTLDQEEEHVSRGYARPGMNSAGDFMLSKASQFLRDEIAAFNQKYAAAMRRFERLENLVHDLVRRVENLESPTFGLDDEDT